MSRHHRTETAGSPPTILDVAKLAGVSKSTVSRVLDERRPSQSPHVEAVRRAAHELGYQRDIFASGMRRGETNTVGLVVPRLTDTTMAVVYEEISKVCRERGKLALVATSEHSISTAQQAVATLLERRVDGIIITTDQRQDPTTSQLREQQIPHVCALRSEGQSPAAVGDDELGGFLATSHLISQGHQRIALINGATIASSARGRAAGYRRALEEADLPVDESLIRETDFTVMSAAENMSSLLNSGKYFTACFGATDNLAIGAISSLTSQGLSVPDDVSVVGYNDIPLAQHMPVPLSTVRIPFREIAKNCLDLLAAQSSGPGTEPIRHVSKPELIIRSSSRPPS